MKINKFKISIVSVMLVALLLSGGQVRASEYAGSLSTVTVMVAPIESPVAAIYASPQTVSLSAIDSLSIHYTTDGSIPDCSTGTVYSGAFLVSSTQTINAIACYPDGYSSTVASLTYTIDVTSGGNGTHGGGSSSSSSSPCNNAAPASTPDLSQINAGNTSVKLFFTPISNTNQFDISFSIKPSAEDYWTEVTLARENVQSYTVYQLKPNTTYYFKVRGQNGCTAGSWSNVMKVTTRSNVYSAMVSFFKNSISKPISTFVQKITKSSKPIQVTTPPMIVSPTQNLPQHPTQNPPQNSPTSVPEVNSAPVVVPPVAVPTPKKFCFLWWCF